MIESATCHSKTTLLSIWPPWKWLTWCSFVLLIWTKHTTWDPFIRQLGGSLQQNVSQWLYLCLKLLLHNVDVTMLNVCKSVWCCLLHCMLLMSWQRFSCKEMFKLNETNLVYYRLNKQMVSYFWHTVAPAAKRYRVTCLCFEVYYSKYSQRTELCMRYAWEIMVVVIKYACTNPIKCTAIISMQSTP